MKRLMLVLFFVVVLSGVAFVVMRQKAPAPPAASPQGNPALAEAKVPPAIPETPASSRSIVRPADNDSVVMSAGAPASVAPPSAAVKTDFERAIDLLVSPQATLGQKWAVWRQLREAGELDQAIAALEKGAANNPAAPEYPIALGEAYINKIPAATDPQDPAILGLKADQSFDKALGLDPSNWEAQFSKAAALSHWPPELNKGEEVIQRLSSLIDQQEKLPSQPQFAQTYVLLGEQYQKAGKPDYAEQVWRLGASRFPGDPTLQGKTTNPPRQ